MSSLWRNTLLLPHNSLPVMKKNVLPKIMNILEQLFITTVVRTWRIYWPKLAQNHAKVCVCVAPSPLHQKILTLKSSCKGGCMCNPISSPSLALLSHKNNPPTRHPRLSHMIDEYISACLDVAQLVPTYWNAL